MLDELQKRKLQEMYQLTEQQEQMDEQQINSYVEREKQRRTTGDPADEQDMALRTKLANMLMLDQDADGSLQELLPEAHAQKEAQMEALQRDASRSGMDKVKNDFTAKRRRAARRQLKEIDAKRNEIRQKRVSPVGQYIPAEQREIEKGSKHSMLRSAMNYFGLGSHEERHADKYYPSFYGARREDLEVRVKSGMLRGASYWPNNVQEPQKVVIVFTGSGGPGAAQVEGAARAYTEAGARVIQLDYRGYGKSETLKKNGETTGTHLCEASLYEDGREIYEAVRRMGYLPSNIILHGFSLGGAVASKVAADIAEENAQKIGRGETVSEKDCLGGLVLNSAMASMEEAATDMVGLSLAGKLGRMGAGAYDTRAHMRRLHRFDPNIPVHYRSGTSNNGDHLGLNVTRLDQDPEAQFVNSSSTVLNGNHMDGNMQQMVQRSYTDSEGKQKFYSDKGDTNAAGIDEMVRRGRHADLRGEQAQ